MKEKFCIKTRDATSSQFTFTEKMATKLRVSDAND